MNRNVVYLADMGHNGGMAAPIIALSFPVAGQAHGRRLALAGLLLTVSIVATPLHAETGQRFDLSGLVVPRCSAVSPPKPALGVLADDPAILGRSATVRCSGPNPVLSVRTRALSNPAVTLSARDAGGQIHFAEAGIKLSGGADARLATGEGNVHIDLADGAPSDPLSSADDAGGAVEITVSPAV
jgi:hypothetical protein